MDGGRTAHAWKKWLSFSDGSSFIALEVDYLLLLKKSKMVPGKTLQFYVLTNGFAKICSNPVTGKIIANLFFSSSFYAQYLSFQGLPIA